MSRVHLAPVMTGALFLMACAENGPGEPIGGTDGETSEGGDDGDSGSDDNVDETAGESDESLEGRWRIVAYETTGAAAVAVTDTNDSVSLPGLGLVSGRVNGLMWIRADRVAFASALLFDDHVFPNPAVTDYEAALQVQGGAAPGTLEDDTFTLSGSTLTYDWSRQANGTILQVDTYGSVTTWERVETLDTVQALLTEGQVALFQPTDSLPLQAPRVAVAWDLPGGADVLTTHDSALDMVSGYAWFPLDVAEAPADALSDVNETSVAVGHLIVYDDLDGSGSYTGGTDGLRGVSAIGLAFRAAGDDGALADTRYSELLPGWQFVHFHQDYSHGDAPGLAPFDPTVFVAPDLIVDVAPQTEPIPDVVP